MLWAIFSIWMYLHTLELGLILCISIRNNWRYVFDLTDATLSWREMLSECICYVAFEPVSLIFDLSFECNSILHARHSQWKILTSSPQINQIWSPNSFLNICKCWRLVLINAILISSKKVDRWSTKIFARFPKFWLDDCVWEAQSQDAEMQEMQRRRRRRCSVRLEHVLAGDELD